MGSSPISRIRKTFFIMIDTEIYSKIDDDKKLKIKYYNKCNNAKKEGLKCELTFEEFFELLLEAGLKSSQLGFSGEGYVLARYNDEGNYKKGNCRFILQKENAEEKKISQKVRLTSQKNISKYNIGIGRNVNLKPLSENYEESTCIDCGKKISHKSIRCLECENKNRQQHPNYKANIDKDKLKELIKKYTLIEIGNMYGVSETTIRKRLKKFGIKNPRGFS